MNFKDLFQKKTDAEKIPPQSERQRIYRAEFGDIVDKVLISYNNQKKFIIYIDSNNEINCECNGALSNPDLKKDQYRNIYLTKLDIAQRTTCLNLSDKEILNFKILLGAGYNAVFYGIFELVDPVIKQALEFINDRNKEQARFLSLFSASIFAFFCVVLFFLYGCCEDVDEWSLGLLMGVLGAYMSIWTRYEKWI